MSEILMSDEEASVSMSSENMKGHLEDLELQSNVPYQLVVSVDSAEISHLRMQIENNVLVSVKFNGNSGDTRLIKSSFSPEWKEKVLLPVFFPCKAKKILVKIIIEKIHQGETLLDEFEIDFPRLLNEKLNWQWFFLYTGLLKSIYAGKILISASAVPSDSPTSGLLSEKKAVLPRLRKYILWFELLEVAGFNIKDTLQVKIEIGTTTIETNPVKGSAQRWLWEKYSVLPEKIIDLPESICNLPKVFIKVASIEQEGKIIGFIEYSGNQIVLKGSRPEPPSWTQFLNIPGMKLPYLGFALFRINLIPIGNLDYFRPPAYKIPYGIYEIRALVYQAQGIKISDIGGLSDPFVTISVNGVTKSTSIEKQCLNPQWLEILSWRTDLNSDLKSCNYLQIDLWNWNEPPQDSEHIGTTPLLINEIPKETLVKPIWYYCKSKTQDNPKVLISFALYKLNAKSHLIPPVNLKSISGMITCKLQVLMIGIRNVNKEFMQDDAACFIRISTGNKASMDTKDAKNKGKLSGHRNFIEVLEVEIQTQRDPAFAPTIVFKAIGKGNYNTEYLIGAVSVNLGTYLPWASVSSSPNEKPKTFTKTSENSHNLTEITENNEEVKKVGELKKVQKIGRKKIKNERKKTEIFDENSEINFEEIPVLKWPKYKPKEYSRKTIQGKFEETYPSEMPFETLNLMRMNTVGLLENSGQIRFMIQILKENDQNKLRKISSQFHSSTILYARFYIYEVQNLSTSPDPQVYVWLSSNENNEQHKYTGQIFSSASPRIMNCYTLKIDLPTDAYVRLGFWNKKTRVEDELLGFYDFDIETRWFNKEYQKLKNLGVENIPIETLKLEKSLGEVTICLELLDENEYKVIPQELLVPQFESMYELRIVIWKVKEMTTVKAKDISVQVFFEHDEAAVEITDIHKNAEDSAEFNWRMKFPVLLPSENSIICFEVHDSKSSKVFGYLNLDLNEFFIDVHKSLNYEKLSKTWIEFFDGNGKKNGKIQLECGMMLLEEAEENPVGEGRSQPNKDPPLPAPTSGRDFEEIKVEIENTEKFKKTSENKYKKYIAIMLCIILAISVPVIVVSVI